MDKRETKKAETPLTEDPRHRSHVLRIVEQACRWLRAVNGKAQEVSYTVEGGCNRSTGELLMVRVTIGVIPEGSRKPGLLLPPAIVREDGEVHT